MKKKFVLIALFVLPVVAYLFFSSGVYNFAKLPLISEGVHTIEPFASSELITAEFAPTTPLTLEGRVTLLGYLGDQLQDNLGYTANLNLMIYKYFVKYEDFQMVLFVNKGNEQAVEELKIELGRIFDVSKMRFIAAPASDAKKHFESLQSETFLSGSGDYPDIFLIDKTLNLRGGHEEKKQNVYGYDFTQAVEMGYLKDDVKILLAEYRLALKKNNNASPELEQRRAKKEE